MLHLTFSRDRAAEHRRLAGESKLENVREMHERSALVWEEMASQAERTAHKAAINLAAKQAATNESR